MEAKELISKLQVATFPAQVFTDTVEFQKEYRELSKLIHPDICSEPGASDAFTKLGLFKDELENGKTFKDDCGEYKSNGYWCKFKSDLPNLNWSIENYRLFKQLKSEADINFQRYLPMDCIIASDKTSYEFKFDKRAIPLAGLILPQEHINWVISRILEYCAYLSDIGFVHCGLTPESVFIVPETHGIQIVSFYHLTRIGNKMKTVSGKYTNWYPAKVFSEKIATPQVDLEMTKRIGAYIMGDKSGIATRFRKTHNENFINFLTQTHTNAYVCYTEYRKMLEDNFKKEFHLLNI